MQPSQRRVPQAQQPPYSFSGGYVANGTNTYDQRFQPQYGSQSHYSGSDELRNGWAPQNSVSYGSSTNDYGYYGTQGSHSNSYSRQLPRRDRHDRNRQETAHQSALASHHHPKKAKTNGQVRGGHEHGYRNSWGEGNTSSNSDEILFEAFHCVKTGKDYSVINVDGVRYFVNSWDAGTELP